MRTAEVRARASSSARRRLSDPKERAKLTAAGFAAWHGAGERRARTSEVMSRRWRDSKDRPKLLAAVWRVAKDRDLVRRRNLAIKRSHSSASYLRKWSDAITRGHHFRDTAPEKRIAAFLRVHGIRFRRQKYIAAVRVRCDFYVRPNITIFVDGCYHHRCPDHGSGKAPAPMQRRNMRRDAVVNTGFKRNREFRLIRIWEHESENPPGSFIRAIRLGRASGQ
jgi:DNA mismatch endonuclease (patch repair protein)